MQHQEISDKELNEYVNEAFTEQLIQNAEDHLLAIMKHRHEKYPTEMNDKEWLDYTYFVCRRRCKRSNRGME